MRTRAMYSKKLYTRPIPVSRIVHSIADKAQSNTQQYGKRPYGVGLLIVGYDQTGPHIWEFLPSGLISEYIASAIGARSQSARTISREIWIIMLMLLNQNSFSMDSKV